MVRYCLECGGELNYDTALRQYACKSCGMTYSEQDLLEGRGQLISQRDTAEERHKRRQKDYLQWWLSKK